MTFENASDHVMLAVEIIRQIENMQVADETAVEAVMLVIQDILNKMPREERLIWRNRLSRTFELPPSLKSNLSDVSFRYEYKAKYAAQKNNDIKKG